MNTPTIKSVVTKENCNLHDCYQAAPNVNIHQKKKTEPANWFAIPTLLDDLLTVLLHMTYLNTCHQPSCRTIWCVLYTTELTKGWSINAQFLQYNQHPKKFSLQHNHIQKTHGNIIPLTNCVLLYYCNAKVGSTLHFLILILFSLKLKYRDQHQEI